MRFADWDVLLFPAVPAGTDPKFRVPSKEFGTACSVVADTELAQTHSSPGIPLMTCFVPSMPAGALFNISIHTWSTPEISQYTRNYSAYPESARFECRIIIDGRLVCSSSFERDGEWPRLITDTFECTKNGELRPLRFPVFRREVMTQNHWNPGDDIGRIKVVISEGFPRDSLTVPIERTRNIVAFSFQHAPLELLEHNGVAWPNPQMWRRPQNMVQVPSYHPNNSAELHSHSPRRTPMGSRMREQLDSRRKEQMQLQMLGLSDSAQNQTARNGTTPRVNYPGSFTGCFTKPINPSDVQGFPPSHPFSAVIARNSVASGPASFQDPFNVEQAPALGSTEWANAMTGGISSDADLVKRLFNTGHDTWNYRNFTKSSMSLDTDLGLDIEPSRGEPMHVSGPSMEDDAMSLNVPNNTPIGLDDTPSDLQSVAVNVPNNIPGFLHGDPSTCNTMASVDATMNPPANMGDFDVSLAQSLLNQPMHMPLQPQTNLPLPAAEIKSKKENRQITLASSNTPSAHSTPTIGEGTQNQVRKVSQPNFTTTNGVSMSSSAPIIGTPTLRSISEGVMGNVGTKRSRAFTPASARVIDEEDEPRRPSPRSRVADMGLEG